ncbi:unnamed protein product [Angiostrongylus costaricensis]|uniref:Uncharacterized protein n=1 Tax=Angiostrongylus costaricensis TaxID=334426 RepID=A0A0R3Q0S0_ANGCS|nr:unnamed protein product [Angiostrongylus costaricensis]
MCRAKFLVSIMTIFPANDSQRAIRLQLVVDLEAEDLSVDETIQPQVEEDNIDVTEENREYETLGDQIGEDPIVLTDESGERLLHVSFFRLAKA